MKQIQPQPDMFIGDIIDLGKDVFEAGKDIVSKIGSIFKSITDKVPGYPVKSKNTFNSLNATVQRELPIETVKDVEELKALYNKAVMMLADVNLMARLANATPGHRSTETLRMLIEERKQAMEAYLRNLPTEPAKGSGGLTAGVSSNPLLIIVLIAALVVGVVFMVKKGR